MNKVAERVCPICGRAAEERYRPFCSVRCANVDLSRWLNEGYRIPARPDNNEEDSSSEDDDRTAAEALPGAAETDRRAGRKSS